MDTISQATNVGGAYVNGTAEIIASRGLLWTQAPIGYCIGLFIGGWFYGPKMRRANYVTMYDPFQKKYGARVGALMCVPEFVGDIFWTAAILSALGSTVAIILDVDNTTSIIVSAAIAVFYTLLGGLWSVAYTDLVQLFFIAIGLIVSFPFALHHPSLDKEKMKTLWSGTLPTNEIGSFLDIYGLLIFGGIPWQPFYQRVLACKTPRSARISLMLSSVLCLLFAVPPAVMGVIGASADWNQTSYPNEVPLAQDQLPFILPLVLEYMCPLPVSVIGLAAISAAAMSSADSTTLSTASIFANNWYRGVFRTKVSDRELIWVVRITVLVVGSVGAAIAITSNTVYGLYVMSGDLMYVILFPQLTCVLFVKVSNAYGSICGFFLSVILRMISGEPLIGLPALISYPFHSEKDGQLFPFRTFIMLLAFVTIITVSFLAETLFTRNIIPMKYDFLNNFHDNAHIVDTVALGASTTEELVVPEVHEKEVQDQELDNNEVNEGENEVKKRELSENEVNQRELSENEVKQRKAYGQVTYTSSL
ncbi:high affinity choline transporter 1-like [Haliotis rubra]|uniref:high affinity choline transporter 1-like n=1 Tax=Haliotis rubra TaxID=36100 RepID=UPI001EE5D176|nr:high affinity choline transporter 1-like [Haliotis rubra]